MNTARGLSPGNRDRAVERLRNLTAGTALASLAGVAAFGSVAAITHPGASTASTGGSTTTDSGTTDSTGSGSDSSGSSTTHSSGTDTTGPSGAGLQGADNAATTTTRGGQVTSGGS